MGFCLTTSQCVLINRPLSPAIQADSKATVDVTGQSVQVRPLQFPMQHVQQTVPVQVPVTANNGQTIYQTVHFPIQALSNVFNMGAQMIPQIAQVNKKLII